MHFNKWTSLRVGMLLAGVMTLGEPAIAQFSAPPKDVPLSIQKQGSFYVNEQTKTTAFPSGTGTPAPGQISVNGMYVEYQIPTNQVYKYPVIMVHGSGHTGKTYDETPDGRDGWKTYFLRKGFAVYVVDHVGRGRSGFDPTINNQAKLQSSPALLTSLMKFTNNGAWGTFRFGPSPYTWYPDTQFPKEAFDEYAAQMVPNTETTLDPDCTSGGTGCTLTPNAIGALLEKIGPAIIIGHSQGGTISMLGVLTRPGLVKAVIPVEPATACVISDANLPLFKNIPMLSIFGDYTTLNNSFWNDVAVGCSATAARIRGVGGKADNVVLPNVGIKGNSHMMMLEKNSDRIADLIINWIATNVK